MLKASLIMLAWCLVLTPFVGPLWAAVSGFVVAVTYEIVRCIIDVIHIRRHPLDAMSPTNQDLDRYR